MSSAPVTAWARLLRAYAATTRDLSAQLQAEHGLTLNDYEALFVLSHAPEGAMRRVDLAGELMLTPSGVTRLLDGLQDAGYVCKKACATDARVSYAMLTDRGRAKLEEASGSHLSAVAELFRAHLSDEDLGSLADLLGRLPGVAGDDACCAPGQS